MNNTPAVSLDLWEAAAAGLMPRAKELIEGGADIDDMKHKCSPLSIAVQRNQVNMCEFLIRSGANISATDKVGKTWNFQPLHHACLLGLVGVARLLCANGADVSANVLTDTPMNYAVRTGSHSNIIEILQLLYENEADISAKGITGKTVLATASGCGKTEVVRWLISKGASVFDSDTYGRGALYYAVKHGHTDIADVLIDNGADVLNVDIHQKNLLHDVADAGALLAVKYLLSKGGIDPSKQDIHGRTPLHNAAISGYIEIVKALFDAGANLNIQDNDGRTAVHWCCLTDVQNFEMLRLLGDLGAELEISDNAGSLPSDVVVQHGHGLDEIMLLNLLEQLMLQQRQRKRWIAFALGNQPGSGEFSHVLGLDPELVRLVLQTQV
jgi:ankyrin repeat protein